MSKCSLSAISAGLLLAAGLVFGQAPAAGPAFEVATIKPAAPLNPAMVASGKLHVGVSIDAARVDIGFLSLSDLIRTAYRVKTYQVSGPDWMATERFDILAKMPEGASKDQVPEMLQALLADRFKLTIHRDSKDQPVYALLVGKNGPRLKESPPDTDTPAAAGPDGAPSGPAAPAGGGGVTVNTGNGPVRVSGSMEGKGMVVSGGPNGQTKMSMGPGGTMHLETLKMTMAGFAEVLSRFVDRPVVDMTGLKGNYQVAFDLTMEDLKNVARASGMMVPGMGGAGGEPGKAPADAASDPAGSSIFSNVQQLGLKLESRKQPVELIVVDHLEKTPTEN
ncbi:MAG TPA: TIGR03435 family protein [Bryobacteraceae bacterium]|nr:TIGR03435 family protein [Bryobacteraceae bacterium]